jgi:hypothetical protein
MVREQVLEAVVEPSETWIVKLAVPVVVGVPEITPVEEFSDRPACMEPEVIDQVYEPEPPVAWRVVE